MAIFVPNVEGFLPGNGIHDVSQFCPSLRFPVRKKGKQKELFINLFSPMFASSAVISFGGYMRGVSQVNMSGMAGDM